MKNVLQKMEKPQNIFLQPELSNKNAAITKYKKRFLIRFGEYIKLLPVEDIIYCYSENRYTYACSLDGRTYPLDHNLDQMETQLNPFDFFRINRQFIISLKAINEMKVYSKARVIIKLKPEVKEQPVVSTERAANFKKWLSGEM
jgi:DNA-binding LytR/AlgR family response regulator